MGLAAAGLAAISQVALGWAGGSALPALPGGWSAPAGLSPCRAAGPPRVVFPAEGPSQATGPGALAWAAAAGCPTGAGARVDPVGPGPVA